MQAYHTIEHNIVKENKLLVCSLLATLNIKVFNPKYALMKKK